MTKKKSLMERLFSRINYKIVKGSDITNVFRNKVIKFMPDGFINVLACEFAYKCDMCFWCYFFVLACIFIALLLKHIKALCFYMFDCWLPCHKQQNKTMCCTYNWKNQTFFENKWAFCAEKVFEDVNISIFLLCVSLYW